MSEVILVTGSPRGGTTPVGAMISLLPGAATLYEPMGSTGDRRFHQRFPIPHADGFDTDDLARFVADIRARRLTLKPQQRREHGWARRLAVRLVGTRTLATYRLLQLRPRADPIVWKDPQAAFCATFGRTAGFRTVMTVRPPLAHAASFKRLGWVSDVNAVYRSYRQAFGVDMDCEHWISQVGSTPFGSAAILWHMIYAPVVGQAHGTKDLFLLNMENVAKDEIGGYRQLFHWLGRPMPQKLERLVAKRQTAESRAQPRLGQVHDFNRTAASANSYWAQVLSAEEAELVTRINGNLWERLCVFGEGLPKEMVPRVDSLH